MKKILISLSLLPFLASPAPALKKADHVNASLISEVESIQPGQPFWLALRLEMKEHWHTYWKNPGESGTPTKIKWDLPPGFEVGPIQWPAPTVIAVPPVVSYGYEKEAWLLNKINVPSILSPGQEIDIKAHVDWLECEVECIPGEADLSVRLPVKDTSPLINKDYVQKFSDARARLPLSSSEWTTTAIRDNKKIQIYFSPPSWFQGGLTSVRFYPDSDGVIDYAAPQIFHHRKDSFSLTLSLSENSSEIPKSLSGVMVAEPGWRGPGSEKAVEIQIPVSEGHVDSSSPNSHLLLILLFAFIGGLILNLMPCVLPILSIKILGLVQHRHAHRKQVITQTGLFTLGILVTFWILAGALLFLRAGGQQLGWGFQLQSPLFVFLLISLFTLLSLNLFGVFELGASLTRLGALSSQAQGGWGAFLSGALTTTVATPCTAPFMGSALGFASTQPALVSLLIFTFLGLGVAAPYIAISIFPKLSAWIPKPGEWMIAFKEFLGFILLATVVWLLWVLNQQKAGAMIPVLFTLLIQVFAAWILGRWGQKGSTARSHWLGTMGFLGLLLISLLWGYQTVSSSESARPFLNSKNDVLPWEPFSSEAIENYRKEGYSVFVDFTAAWCLTCKVNERVALNSPAVIQKFRDKNIRLIKADWTSRDSDITNALQRFGRNGVPLYVLYSPDLNAPPFLLPEILTPQIVISALEKTK